MIMHSADIHDPADVRFVQPYVLESLLQRLSHTCLWHGPLNSTKVYLVMDVLYKCSLLYAMCVPHLYSRLINDRNISPMGRGILTFPTRATHCPGCWNNFQIIHLKADAAVLGAIACTHIHTSTSSRCIVPSSS